MHEKCFISNIIFIQIQLSKSSYGNVYLSMTDLHTDGTYRCEVSLPIVFPMASAFNSLYWNENYKNAYFVTNTNSIRY